MPDEDEKLWVTAPVDISIDLGKGYLVSEYIRANMDNWGWGETIAFESAETGRKYTHNQVLENGRAFGAGLIKLGAELNLQRTNVIAVILLNIPEYPSILCGIWEAGLVATTVNPYCVKNEISRQLEVSRSRLIITSSQFLSVAQAIQKENKLIQRIILVEQDSNNVSENYVNYFEMLQTDTKGVDFFTGSQMTEENDIAMLPFSSGTSGHSKGVMLTHSALLANFILMSHPQVSNVKRYEGGNEQERLLVTVPFFHIYGIAANIFVSMLQGIHVITMSGFNSSTFIEKLCHHKPTVLYLVPTLVSLICNNDKIGQVELDQVHSIMCGAAPVGEALIKRIRDKAKNASIFEIYGLTETSGAISLARSPKIGSAGQLFPKVVSKVVDITTGVTLGKSEQGEVCLKTPTVMKGYLNNEQATREVIDKDGWFHTGDIGYYDEEGYLFIVDRLKELIKVKGFQVAPAELEDLIRTNEKVGDVGVVGIQDEIFGEIPRAFIVPKTGHYLTEIEVIDFVHKQVSAYKRLRGGVQFVQEIPKGGSGKILRRVLRDMYSKN